MQPIMLGRPDSDARLLLSDSSLSLPNEPDPKVRAEDESSCKLTLISASQQKHQGPSALFTNKYYPRRGQGSPWQHGMGKQVMKTKYGRSINQSKYWQLVNLLHLATDTEFGERCHTLPTSVCLSGGCSHPFSGVYVVVMFMNFLLHFALSILYESRRRNYALVASARSQAGERGEGTSGTW